MYPKVWTRDDAREPFRRCEFGWNHPKKTKIGSDLVIIRCSVFCLGEISWMNDYFKISREILETNLHIMNISAPGLSISCYAMCFLMWQKLSFTNKHTKCTELSHTINVSNVFNYIINKTFLPKGFLFHCFFLAQSRAQFFVRDGAMFCKAPEIWQFFENNAKTRSFQKKLNRVDF